jgi:hypothetical protein
MASHLEAGRGRAVRFLHVVASKRAAALGLALASTSVLLAACIGAPVTATPTGTGSVTIGWSGAADAIDPYRDVLALCSVTQTVCGPDNPGSTLFFYAPAVGSTSATLAPGVPVWDETGTGAAVLPAGRYSLQAYSDTDSETTGLQYGPVGDLLHIEISGPRDLTIWWQSISRESASAPCASGWKPSWAQWPNDGAGGYVCNKKIYAYYPDEPVLEPGAEPAGEPWLLASTRDSAEAACPDGYDPSWAQWPGDGAGGFVCNKLSD